MPTELHEGEDVCGGLFLDLCWFKTLGRSQMKSEISKGRARRDWRKAEHSRLVVADLISKGAYKACLGIFKRSKFPSFHQILKISIECSVTYTNPDDLRNTLLSQGSVLENTSHYGNGEQNIYQGYGGVDETWTAQSQVRVNL